MDQEIEIDGFKLKELFCDQYGDPYAAFESNGNRTVTQVAGKKFKGYLRDSRFESAGEILSSRKIDALIEHFSALAYLSKNERTLHVRVAKDIASDFLVDGLNETYRINAAGWRPIADSPIIFRQPASMKELVRPKAGGDLRKILDFVNLRDSDDQLLLFTFIVSAFVPDIAHPLLALHGPQGSGKSTFLKMMVRLIDPSSSEDVHFTDERDFLISVANRWVVPLDNISKIKESTSDLLCKFVTESSFSRRRLYTDDEEYTRTFRRVVILNGINSPMRKPDILDRSLLINLEAIKPTARRDEVSIWNEYRALQPDILGGCFDVLSKAMAILPTINLVGKPRLADFAIWACAIARGLGYTDADFIRAYEKNIQRQTDEALDASPLASALICYLRGDRKPTPNRTLTGTPSSVLRTLRNVAAEAGVDEKYLPQSARGLTNALKEIQSNLEARGYVIDRIRGKERIITISPPKEIAVTSVPSEPSEAPAFGNLPKFPPDSEQS
jgi:energy-coupling factor transporter ATP-binding protein EcfA2